MASGPNEQVSSTLHTYDGNPYILPNIFAFETYLPHTKCTLDFGGEPMCNGINL
jgi:hypothetical protein